MTETIGVAAALFPAAWLSLFDRDPAMIAAGSPYLRIVGPFYGFFGLGMALYFASQGAGALTWPLLAGVSRLVIAVGGGYLLLRWTGSLTFVYAALAAGLADAWPDDRRRGLGRRLVQRPRHDSRPHVELDMQSR